MPSKLFSQTYWDVTLNNAVNGDMCKLGTFNSQPIRFFSANNEYMFLSTTGNFGIGITNPWTNNPSSLLSVGTTEGFQVNGSGDITKINGIDYSFPSIQATASDDILVNDGSGNLSWTDPSTLFTSNAWDLGGNTISGASIHVLGTQNNYHLSFITNGNNRMILTTDGDLGIGIQIPQSTLHIHSEKEESGGGNNNGSQNGGFTVGNKDFTNIAVNSFQITNKISGTSKDDGLFLSLKEDDIVLLNKETGHINFVTSKTALSVFPSGNVGIGTTQGDARLNITAIKQNGINIKMPNSPTSTAVNVIVYKQSTKSFVSSYGKTENFVVYGNGETQIMNGREKFYFGECSDVQNASGNTVYATNYLGFNAVYDKTADNWTCDAAWNNGGAVIWSTVGGDICFSNFESDISSGAGQTQQLAGSELVENRAMMIHGDGSVSIGGYHTGSFTLAVEGSIGARRIKITENPFDWYDHVFAEDYNLMSIEDLSIYIKEYQHLPEIPTQEDVNNDGLDLGEINAKLLLKVEELTLYIIQLNEQMKAMQEEINSLKN